MNPYNELLNKIYALSMEGKNPFIRVKYASEVKLLKTGRDSGESPDEPIIYKISDFQVMIGDSFITMLQNKEKKVTGEIITDKTEKPKGKSWLVYPYILQSDKENDRFYLRTYKIPDGIIKHIPHVEYKNRIGEKMIITDSYKADYFPAKQPEKIPASIREYMGSCIRDLDCKKILEVHGGDIIDYSKFESVLK